MIERFTWHFRILQLADHIKHAHDILLIRIKFSLLFGHTLYNDIWMLCFTYLLVVLVNANCHVGLWWQMMAFHFVCVVSAKYRYAANRGLVYHRREIKKNPHIWKNLTQYMTFSFSWKVFRFQPKGIVDTYPHYFFSGIMNILSNRSTTWVRRILGYDIHPDTIMYRHDYTKDT